VACVPYDVINEKEARALVENNPYSFLRVTRSEVEFDKDQNPYADETYNKSRQKLLDFISDGILIQDDEPAVYIYQQKMGSHIQTGIVACSAVDDYDSGVIKLHEKTRPDKEDDRTKHLLTLGAHQGPVFLTFNSTPAVNSLVTEGSKGTPLYEVTGEDGVVHTVWKASQSSAICEEFENIPCTYVADGHHRAASASRARAELREKNPEHTGDEGYNVFLTVLFPADQVSIMAYNRVIIANDLDAKATLEKLSAIASTTPCQHKEPANKGEVCVYIDKTWHSMNLAMACKAPSDPVRSLDASVLQEEVLAPLFGVEDPRTSKNVSFIGGSRGTKELERLVDSGEASIAFSMFPVSIEDLISVSDNGQTMPPKSTWFEPKLRSGLFVHPFNLEK
jgi:uncharacterized protein (DUF1015 family)